MDDLRLVPPTPPLVSRVPGTVTAAAVATISAAAISLGSLLLLVAVYAVAGAAIISSFSPEDATAIAASLIGTVVVALAMCVLAIGASIQLLRRRRWAWWTLVLLAPVTAVAGVMAAFYLVPLLFSATAIAVFVLLVVPATRAWFAAAEGSEALYPPNQGADE